MVTSLFVAVGKGLNSFRSSIGGLSVKSSTFRPLGNIDRDMALGSISGNRMGTNAIANCMAKTWAFVGVLPCLELRTGGSRR